MGSIMVLQNNDTFPSLTFPLAGGGEIQLPGDLADGFGVILFYRGSWSDACVEQLDAFSRAATEFDREGIKVVSVSIDDRETTEALAEKHELAFPVAYAAHPHAVSAVAGVPINEDTAYFEATGFIINPEGRIETAVYSTYEGFEDRIVTATYSNEPVTRLSPDAVLRLVRGARSSGTD
ncbi:redoxin domain-containing protein [Pelagerythrobacter aerophilus]